MDRLAGKTIQNIKMVDSITIGINTYHDDCIEVTFTDGTVWALASWDYEEYNSGIKMLINSEQVS